MAQMSVRGARRCVSPRTCSGAMYAGVPAISPALQALQVLPERQAEVGDMRPALSVDQDVRGLQIAVDQPGPMGVFDRLGDVDHQPRDPRGGEVPVLEGLGRFRPSTYSKTTKDSPSPSP